MKSGLLAVLLIFFTAPLFCGTNEMLSVLKKLEEGWEKKDIGILSNCFKKFSPAQEMIYRDIFSLVSNVNVDITVREASIENKLGYARCVLKKEMAYAIPGAVNETRRDEKEIIYVFYYSLGRWCIIGTLDPNAKPVQQKMVTPENIETINKQLKQIPGEYVTNAFRDYQEVSVSNLMVNWDAQHSAQYYNISLKDQGSVSIWEFKGVLIPWVKLPRLVFDRMKPETFYYFYISAFTPENKEISRQVKKLKAVK